MHFTTALTSLLALSSTSQALAVWRTYATDNCTGDPFGEPVTIDLWDSRASFCHNQEMPFKSFAFAQTNDENYDIPERINSESEICDLIMYSDINCYGEKKIHTYLDIFATRFTKCQAVIKNKANPAYGHAKSTKLECRPRRKKHSVSSHTTKSTPKTTKPKTTKPAKPSSLSHTRSNPKTTTTTKPATTVRWTETYSKVLDLPTATASISTKTETITVLTGKASTAGYTAATTTTHMATVVGTTKAGKSTISSTSTISPSTTTTIATHAYTAATTTTHMATVVGTTKTLESVISSTSTISSSTFTDTHVVAVTTTDVATMLGTTKTLESTIWSSKPTASMTSNSTTAVYEPTATKSNSTTAAYTSATTTTPQVETSIGMIKTTLATILTSKKDTSEGR
ncbi:uncharacterized protein RCC_03558 [Ramularia collo-cygni]|uniref:Uncharacterized protein n=1 Tax=Ramularia collo-cygni TaxID=112498 RepID=A0A2D3UQ40_9PEZI|nr:uncharacterized protein RCC_03558 [Ramularia collo-cygni]CZT17721.1 uncharacterized protein RCC_03558 [Ramularia collo-cygni]